MDELTRHRAIGELSAYSLVRPDAGTVSVHRLVQAATRDTLGTTWPEWTELAQSLLLAAMPERLAIAAWLTTWQVLRPHLQALLDHLPPEAPSTLATWRLLANWTGQTGDANGARELLANLMPVLERVLGEEHPDTLIARTDLAYFTGEMGHPRGRETAMPNSCRSSVACLVPTTPTPWPPGACWRDQPGE